MGTSQDYAVAAEEGATIVRLGTVLYDERVADALEEVGDRVRQPRALPGERRLALLLDHQLGVGQPAARTPRRSPAGGAGSISSRERHDQHRHLQARERVEPLPGGRARHRTQRLGHLERVLVALHALAHRLARDPLPALAGAARLRHLDERVDAARSSPSAIASPRPAVDVAGARRARCRRA